MASFQVSRSLSQAVICRHDVRASSSSSAARIPAVGIKSTKFTGTGISLKKSVNVVSQRQAITTQAAVEGGADVWNKSYYPKEADHRGWNKPWLVVDAEGQTLGRMSVVIARAIRGHMTPAFTPSVDMGANVVVINAEKVTVGGNKYYTKLYRRHTTGRPGKMKVETFEKLQQRIPERIIEKAVKGMLPKGRLGRRLFTNLKVYKGPEHPHSAQMPEDITALIAKNTAE